MMASPGGSFSSMEYGGPGGVHGVVYGLEPYHMDYIYGPKINQPGPGGRQYCHGIMDAHKAAERLADDGHAHLARPRGLNPDILREASKGKHAAFLAFADHLEATALHHDDATLRLLRNHSGDLVFHKHAVSGRVIASPAVLPGGRGVRRFSGPGGDHVAMGDSAGGVVGSYGGEPHTPHTKYTDAIDQARRLADAGHTRLGRVRLSRSEDTPPKRYPQATSRKPTGSTP